MQKEKHCFKNGYGILRCNKEEIKQFCQSGIFVFNLMPGVYYKIIVPEAKNKIFDIATFCNIC